MKLLDFAKGYEQDQRGAGAGEGWEGEGWALLQGMGTTPARAFVAFFWIQAGRSTETCALIRLASGAAPSRPSAKTN